MASKKVGGTIEAALKDLFKERAVVDDAIAKLQSLLGGVRPGGKQLAVPKRRGRPPKSSALTQAPKVGRKKAGRKASASAEDATPKPRSSWSPAARRQAADRMREYWAKQRKLKAQGKAGTAKRRSRA